MCKIPSKIDFFSFFFAKETQNLETINIFLSSAPPPFECHRQKSWTEPIAKRCQEELIAHADDIHLARLRSCAAPGSGDWLNALPSSALGLSLINDQFRIGCALRLGARFFCTRMCECVALTRMSMVLTPWYANRSSRDSPAIKWAMMSSESS